MLLVRTRRLTITNCEMKSMALYNELFAMTIHSTAGFSSESFSTAVWKVENQLDDDHIGSHDMHNIWKIIYGLYTTHVDIKLYQHYGNDEICRAQKEINSVRVEEYYRSPSVCFLELDSPV